jgi:hypothetical protein
MKSTRRITKFKCDSCPKQSKEVDKKYPYEDGWKYLYSFDFKVTNDKTNNFKDKHFCSSYCLAQYISSRINEVNEEQIAIR